MIDEQFRKKVIETLQRGDDLPADWARSLFPPERREYELTYYGKEREEDIIADTMAVPLQAVSTFGMNDGDWHNMLILGDNLQGLKELVVRKRAGMLNNADGSPGVRLVYIDPPFATKQDFRGTQDQKAYQDKIAGSQFIEFLRKRLILIREILSFDGCIYLHLDYRKVHYVKVVMDEVFGEQNFVNEIIWQRTASHNDPNRYGSVHDTILLYRRGANYTWNSPKMSQSAKYIEKFFVYAESPDRTEWMKLKKGEEPPDGWERYRLGNFASPNPRPNLTYEYKGYSPPANGWKVNIEKMREMDEQGLLHFPKSINGRIQPKQYLRDTVDNKAVPDVWTDISPIQANSAEKQFYPTQKPEALLERIISASSRVGDIVLDCFSGSGTTPAVSEKLGRRWIAIDCGKLAVYTIQKRMLNLKIKIGQKGRTLQPAAFTLYNAGLYDFSTLRKLPWDDWRFFALQLFNCKDEPHTIGGLRLDGKRQGASVLVFNHLENPGRRIDEQTIAEIHAAIGDKIGRRFFIIAPRNTFDFQQDYVDFDGTRYYALRIPYSFINELHRREFSALRQPSDETDVNAIVDAVGFDFIRPPKVGWKVGITKRKKRLLAEAYLRITEFESRASIRGQDMRGGLETLSLLMLDLNFDGKVFDLDRVFYRPELEKNNWAVHLEPTELGTEIMAVFIDVYGNEARIVIPGEQFGVMVEDSAENMLASPLAKEVEGD